MTGKTLEQQIAELKEWATTHKIPPLTERDYGKVDMAQKALEIIMRDSKLFFMQEIENGK